MTLYLKSSVNEFVLIVMDRRTGAQAVIDSASTVKFYAYIERLVSPSGTVANENIPQHLPVIQ